MKKVLEGASRGKNLSSKRNTRQKGPGEYPQTDWPSWRRIGGGDPPDPERCTPEEGRRYYGKHYELWKLGVPLDIRLPPRQDEQTDKEREYDRRIYQRLLARTRKAATRLGELLAALDAAQRDHPAEQERRRLHESANLWAKVAGKAESPFEKSYDARQIGRVRACHSLGCELLKFVGTIRSPKGDDDRSKTEDVLEAAGLGPTEIGRVTALLGMEAPAATDGDLGERVRKRIDRKRAKRT